MSERKAAWMPCVEPGTASVEDGLVVLDGPDGVAVTMTAEAAQLTGLSLQAAASQLLDVKSAAAPADDGLPDGEPS